jgi:hypothetical protein
MQEQGKLRPSEEITQRFLNMEKNQGLKEVARAIWDGWPWCRRTLACVIGH